MFNGTGATPQIPGVSLRISGSSGCGASAQNADKHCSSRCTLTASAHQGQTFVKKFVSLFFYFLFYFHSHLHKCSEMGGTPAFHSPPCVKMVLSVFKCK